MKVIKYGTGMKCKRHYITECGNCHTIFDATPKEVEFLGRNDEPVDHPTPTYRTYCPVCGDTRIYEIKKKKKKSSNGIMIMFILLILLPIIDMFCECIPDNIGSLIRVSIGTAILALTIITFLEVNP
jgi:hypothetical protein